MKLPTTLLTALLLVGCQDQATGDSGGTGTGTTSPAASSPSQGAGQNPPGTASPAASGGNDGRLAYDENTISVVNRTQGGVVFVTRFDQVGGGSLYGGSPLGPDAPPGGLEVPSGTGSGFLIDAQGEIVTNYHVIQGASNLRVRLHQNEQEYEASVVGTAPDYDLALIRARALPAGVRPLTLGDSGVLRVGEKAIALGAPFGLEFTVTQGIVSAVNRVVPTGVNYIPQNSVQTDASINPGNSGGPLVNSRGEVIGVNTQILSPAGAASGVGQSAGVGFAIPVNVVKALLPRLRAGETITVPRIGVVSIPLQALTPSAREALDLPASGILVQSVEPGTPAAAAGLRGGERTQRFADAAIRLGGDIITALDGQEVSTVQDLQSVLIGKQPGDEVTVTVRRGGQTVTRELTLTASSQGRGEQGTPPPVPGS
ncbi:S1C family serine protease [Deinococcus aestuarii]|uniref:S1C family serine protease n=1 Tax=Deinococcus aestuarii TaxID=2774531 RepID=UPI001C0D2783|nr:trypsin-like peptidase domain-containing protein [Deinococcus aestuarii]